MAGKSIATRGQRRTELERALASAAAEPLAILHEDCEHFASTGEPGMAAVLDFLAQHLFDGGTTAAGTARAAGSKKCHNLVNCWVRDSKILEKMSLQSSRTLEHPQRSAAH